jgi:nucleotide-binding universal stress UspA family protein
MLRFFSKPYSLVKGAAAVSRSILVALDGSSKDGLVLQEAIGSARRDGARLTLISVAAPPRWRFMSPYVLPYPAEAELEREARRIVERAEALVPDGVPVSTVVRRGPPAKAILDRVVCGEHDLVVMGSHGWGPVRALLLGSVSRAVAARSPVPVHIVRERSNVEGRAAWTARHRQATS